MLKPIGLKSSEALRTSFKRAPKLNIATLLPLLIIRPLPISNKSPAFGSSTPTPSPLG